MENHIDMEWSVLQERWRRAWARQDRSTTAWGNYALDVRSYLRWCAQEGKDNLTLDAADEYVEHRASHSANAGRNAARAIKAFGKFLAQQYDDVDPFRRLVVPKVPTPTKTPTASQDDLERLLGACGKDWQGLRDRCIILLLCHTGMRRSEVANMAPSDVDLATQRLVIPKTKTKAPRTVWLHDDVVTALLRYRRVAPKSDLMWPSGTDKGGLRPGGIGQMLQRREQDAGLRLGAHSWRRKFAGDWLRAQGSEVGLMQAAGWSSTSMISRYAQSVKQEHSLEEAERLFSGK